jgi:hypothetical protein
MNKLLLVFVAPCLLLMHGCSTQPMATGAATPVQPQHEVLYASPGQDALVLRRANRLALPY